jgi:hypothetical protein
MAIPIQSSRSSSKHNNLSRPTCNRASLACAKRLPSRRPGYSQPFLQWMWPDKQACQRRRGADALRALRSDLIDPTIAVPAIIARLVRNKELPSDVMAEIVERTDGIPLFVEEMTKAVLRATCSSMVQGLFRVVIPPRAGNAATMAGLTWLDRVSEECTISGALQSQTPDNCP